MCVFEIFSQNSLPTFDFHQRRRIRKVSSVLANNLDFHISSPRQIPQEINHVRHFLPCYAWVHMSICTTWLNLFSEYSLIRLQHKLNFLSLILSMLMTIWFVAVLDALAFLYRSLRLWIRFYHIQSYACSFIIRFI